MFFVTFQVVQHCCSSPYMHVQRTSLQEKNPPGKAFFKNFFFNFDKTLQTESGGISVVTPAFREEIV